MTIEDLFFEVVRLALGTQDKLSRNPSKEEWGQIFLMCQQQAIAGVVLDGLERLLAEQRPPQLLLLLWIGDVQHIEVAYSLQCQRAKELRVIFQKIGSLSSVLKGIGFSQYYPVPRHRQGGDIDLWVDGDRKAIMEWLRSQYEIAHVVWHHVDAKIFDDVETEIHFHPGWLYNPIYNKRLQRWFEERKGKQFEVNESLGFAYPTIEFNVVFALVHLYHHLIEEGVGIRHIVDCYYLLKANTNNHQELENERISSISNTIALQRHTLKERTPHSQGENLTNGTNLLKEIESLGLKKITSAVMWVLQEVCGMQRGNLLCEPNEKEGRFLLEDIMRGGNFGKYRSDSRKRNSTARMLALLPHYPSEVLWVVPWKCWHWLWRKCNN